MIENARISKRQNERASVWQIELRGVLAGHIQQVVRHARIPQKQIDGKVLRKKESLTAWTTVGMHSEKQNER